MDLIFISNTFINLYNGHLILVYSIVYQTGHFVSDVLFHREFFYPNRAGGWGLGGGGGVLDVIL